MRVTDAHGTSADTRCTAAERRRAEVAVERIGRGLCHSCMRGTLFALRICKLRLKVRHRGEGVRDRGVLVLACIGLRSGGCGALRSPLGKQVLPAALR